MKIKKARQILKSFADDTRLRIINLLKKGEINVKDMCDILETTQSNLSKHLTRLRLTGIVIDRRDGNVVYYSLKKPTDPTHKELLAVIVTGLKELETFKKDMGKLKEFRNKSKKIFKEVSEMGKTQKKPKPAKKEKEIKPVKKEKKDKKSCK